MQDKITLLDRYFDGELVSSCDEKTLTDWLKADPANMKAFVFEANFHRGIRCYLNNEKPPSNIVRYSFGRRLLVLAASILIILGAGTAVYQYQRSRVVAVLAEVSGDVRIRSRFGIRDAGVGTKIHSAEQVLCGPERKDRAVLRSRDGSVLAMRNGAQMSLTFANGQFMLVVIDGWLRAEVRKQPENQPFLITTPTAALTVLGTKLELDVSVGSTTLSVEEGRVEIMNKLGKKKVLVNEGEIAVVRKDKEIMKTRNSMDDRFKGAGKSGYGAGTGNSFNKEIMR